MSKIFLIVVVWVSSLLLPTLSAADCSCQIGSNWASILGIEYIADTCPVDPPSDDQPYHYINYATKCSGSAVVNYAFYGDSPSYLNTTSLSHQTQTYHAMQTRTYCFEFLSRNISAM